MSQQLSANFTLPELTISQTASRHGIRNVPSTAEVANLKRLCNEILQPLRNQLKKPVVVTSGFRSRELNRAVGGSQTSAHVDGRAADIHVPGMSTAQLVKKIHELDLPFDQVIDEFGDWVHVGIARPGEKPRGQYLSARIHGGKVVYNLSKGF